MSIYWHFFKLSFEGQKRSFFFISFITFLCLAFAIILKKEEEIFFTSSLYANFIYIMIASSPLFNQYANNNSLVNSFSWKYLSSLPIDKKNLLAILTLSNIYILLPTYLTFIVALVCLGETKENDKMTISEIMKFVGNNQISLMLLILLIFILIKLTVIVGSLSLMQRIKNKGNKYAIHFVLKSTIRMVAVIFISIAVVTTSFHYKTIIPITTFAFLLTIGAVGISYVTLSSERWHHWEPRRDILLTIIYTIAAFLGPIAIFVFNYQKLMDISFTDRTGTNYSVGPQIFQSIDKKEICEIKSYLQSNGDLSLTNEKGVSVIHALSALQAKAVPEIDQAILNNPDLLKLKIKIPEMVRTSAIYDEGITPIHLLAYSNNYRVLSNALPKMKEMVNNQTKSGDTPLHFAAMECSPEAAKELLKMDANPSIQDNLGNTPIMTAARFNCPAVLMLFAWKRADFKLKNADGDRASDIARTEGKAHLANILKMIEEGI